MKVFKIITNPKSLNLSPKRLFRSKKSRSTVSGSDPSSFSSGTSSSSTSSDSTNLKPHSAATPKSVLPTQSSGEWSDLSSDIFLDLQYAFTFIDRDNDGVVSRDDLAALLSRLGGQDEVATMLSQVDSDGDGCVTVKALMGQIGSGWEPAGREELKETFQFFDTDHDGKITAEELLKGLLDIGEEKCTLEECRRMLAEVDKNGDGFVCLEDFCRMMDLQR
ncbi:Probable calcium-binding protein CML35 [Linum perenne]